MFNRYFEAGEDSLEFLFAHLAVKNIDFAMISLRCLLEPYPVNNELFPDEHTYVFFHIQSVLTACGNLYNVFYGNGSGAYRYHLQYVRPIQRTTLLREIFDINRKHFPLVFNKAVRNTNEHFDERFDEFRWNIGDYNIVDFNTPRDMRDTILGETHLRTFDRRNGYYHTYIRRKGECVPMHVNLHKLYLELSIMRDQITKHPIFESRWVDRMPGDIIENF